MNRAKLEGLRKLLRGEARAWEPGQVRPRVLVADVLVLLDALLEEEPVALVPNQTTAGGVYDADDRGVHEIGARERAWAQQQVRDWYLLRHGGPPLEAWVT